MCITSLISSLAFFRRFLESVERAAQASAADRIQDLHRSPPCRPRRLTEGPAFAPRSSQPGPAEQPPSAAGDGDGAAGSHIKQAVVASGRVVVAGLAAKPEHNGKCGTVLRRQGDFNERWQVHSPV